MQFDPTGGPSCNVCGAGADYEDRDGTTLCALCAGHHAGLRAQRVAAAIEQLATAVDAARAAGFSELEVLELAEHAASCKTGTAAEALQGAALGPLRDEDAWRRRLVPVATTEGGAS